MPCPIRLGPLPRMTTFFFGVRLRLADLLVGAVHVRRERLELRRAGVDALVGRHEPARRAAAAGRAASGTPRMPAISTSPKPARLSVRSRSGRHLAGTRPPARPACSSTISANCCRNQGSILRQLVHVLDRSSRGRAPRRPPTSADRSAPRAACAARRRRRRRRPRRAGPNSRPVRLPSSSERTRLQERFLEGAADRHRLADRLHLRRQRAVGLAGTSRSSSAGYLTTT